MFTNRVVWITGASSGIGEALAARFARENARVVLSARRQPELERVRQHCIDAGAAPENMLVLPLDVTDLPSLPVAADHVISHFGQIDLLINNAGLSQRSLCKDTELSVYQKLLDVDVMGQIALTKAVLPHMLERQSGHLAVTASVAGKVGVPLRTGYCAAKHAVMGFFDALRAEVEDDGILVSTITPGLSARTFPAMPWRPMALPSARKTRTLPVAWTSASARMSSSVRWPRENARFPSARARKWQRFGSSVSLPR